MSFNTAASALTITGPGLENGVLRRGYLLAGGGLPDQIHEAQVMSWGGVSYRTIARLRYTPAATAVMTVPLEN